MRSIYPRVLLIGIILFGVVRIVGTYRVFNHITDEPSHVGGGLEWLSRGTYTFEQQHPPLARIAVALGPYFRGARFEDGLDYLGNGMLALYRGNYSRTLSLARAGTLPFWIASVLFVYLWARELFGVRAALVSAALYSLLPPILAHASLATTDMAIAAMLTASLWTFQRWLRSPTPGRALIFGIALGLALVSKLSAVVFFPAGALAIAICYLLENRSSLRQIHWWRVMASALLAVAVAFLVLWATFRFTVGPTITAANRNLFEPLVTSTSGRELMYRLGSISIPAPGFFGGIGDVLHHNHYGHPAFLMGRYSQTGWWFYFPVAVLLKTPIPFLFLAVAGTAIVLIQRTRRWERAAPSLAAVAILVSALPGRINIGVRHVLPIYPLLAVAAGFFCVWLWMNAPSRKLWRPVLLVLAGWLVLSSAGAHPDYLPYFNILAGRHPERYLLDSNLDWGQDLLRLSREVRRRGIRSLMLAYAGTADPTRHKLPSLVIPDTVRPTAGWFAISEMEVSHYPWIHDFRPTAKIGHSIRLYRIPAIAGSEVPEAQIDLAPIEYERCLLPIVPSTQLTRGWGGSSWVTTLELTNRSKEPARVASTDAGLHELAFTLGPQSAASNVRLPFEREGAGGAILFVERARASMLDIRIRVREASASEAVSIPGVCEQTLSEGPVRLSGVRSLPGSRTTLRIYDLNAQALRARVMLLDARTNQVTASEELAMTKLTSTRELRSRISFAQFSLEEQFGDAVDGTVIVEVLPSSGARLWALATRTDQTNQTITFIAPDRVSRISDHGSRDQGSR